MLCLKYYELRVLQTCTVTGHIVYIHLACKRTALNKTDNIPNNSAKTLTYCLSGWSFLALVAVYKQTEWVSSVLRPHQHSIGYTGDGFYRSKDPTNSINVLKENLQKKITQRTKKTQNTHAYTQNGKTNTAYNYNTASPLV